MSRNATLVILIAALLLGGGAAAGGWLMGRGLVAAREADRAVVVKGLAERDVRADLAEWHVSFRRAGDGLAAVQAEIERDAEAVAAFLAQNGFSPEETEPARIDVTDLLARSYRGENVDRARYIVSQTVRVRSEKVDLVRGASARLGELVRAGVAVDDGGGPAYLFNGLNGIKPGMIAEATRNARAAAARFAEDSGSGVGAIRHASQGVFQILARTAGAGERAEIEKTVRIVTTVTYGLDG
jgi:hypothetical protein